MHKAIGKRACIFRDTVIDGEHEVVYYNGVEEWCPTRAIWTSKFKERTIFTKQGELDKAIEHLSCVPQFIPQFTVAMEYEVDK